MKKLVCLLLVCTLLAVSAAALAEPVKLVFWDMIWGSAGVYDKAGEALVAEFNASQDEIEVEYPSGSLGQLLPGIFDCHHIRRWSRTWRLPVRKRRCSSPRWVRSNRWTRCWKNGRRKTIRSSMISCRASWRPTCLTATRSRCLER